MARRWHEARCSSCSTPIACEATATPEETAPNEMATGRDLLPHVDRHMDMNNLSLEAMVQTLFISREDLVELHSVNPELCREILSYVVVTWRPGAESRAPLRPALGLGPGRDEGTVVVRAKLPEFKAMTKQTVALECLDNQLIKSAQYDEMVNVGEDLREVALERCMQLQQVARRLGPRCRLGSFSHPHGLQPRTLGSGVSSRGGG